MTQYEFVQVHAQKHSIARAEIRRARSHAVRQALQRKRGAQQASGDNFVVTTLRSKPERRRASGCTAPPCLLLASSLDPFQTLAVDAARLQTLLSDRMSPPSLLLSFFWSFWSVWLTSGGLILIRPGQAGLRTCFQRG